MVYIVNTNINSKKKVFVALSTIFGLGKHQSLQICDQLGISTAKRLKQLTSLDLQNITELITQNYEIGVDIRRFTDKNIQRLIKIGSYKGFRHSQGLPVHGQGTHRNSKTAKKLNHKAKYI